MCDRTHRQEVDGCVGAPLILAALHPSDEAFYLNPGVSNFTAASRGAD